MAFGQSLGPPATRRQVEELLVLLQEAGHADFRDARGPMGFTQRQANGKFTRDEADAFIEQLTREADEAAGRGPADDIGGAEVPSPGETTATSSATPRPARRATTAAERTAANQTAQIRRVPSELLAAELQRRGWVVMEP